MAKLEMKKHKEYTPIISEEGDIIARVITNLRNDQEARTLSHHDSVCPIMWRRRGSPIVVHLHPAYSDGQWYRDNDEYKNWHVSWLEFPEPKATPPPARAVYNDEDEEE